MRFRYLVGGALLGFATSGFAQGSVTLYGILDTGVEYVSHANSAGKGVVRMPAITGELPSRWGLRGSEDLGGGYKAVFPSRRGRCNRPARCRCRRRHRQDLYANLVDWVENGKAPTSIQLSSADGSASQPICMYPNEATYKGTGSIRDATNDSCQ